MSYEILACALPVTCNKNIALKSLWVRSFAGPSRSICAAVPINIDHLRPKCSLFPCNLTRTVLLLLSTSLTSRLTAIQCGEAEAQWKANRNQFLPPEPPCFTNQDSPKLSPERSGGQLPTWHYNALLRDCRNSH